MRGISLRRGLVCSVLVASALGVSPAAAEIVARSQPAAGSVIARKVGEEVRFVDVSNWRFVDLKQDVVAGDYLRTNATGSLAVLFADRTQMRLGRNTTLLVKQVGGAADSAFSLEERHHLGARRARRRGADRRDAGRGRRHPRHRLEPDRRCRRQDLADRARGIGRTRPTRRAR